jgi:hypothetical protein
MDTSPRLTGLAAVGVTMIGVGLVPLPVLAGMRAI